MKIAIALAVYRPDFRFLREQIYSLQRQTWQDWQCVISVDGAFAAAHEEESLSEFFQTLQASDKRFFVLPRDNKQLGPFYNFEKALLHIQQQTSLVKFEAVAFCDQDDVWHPEKLVRLQEHFEKNRDCYLVHSDLRVVNAERALIAESCWDWEMRDLNPGIDPLKLILRNSVTGCACMFRISLLTEICPFPKGVQKEYLHDQWAALIARTYAPLGVCPERLIDYRQHGKNAVGAQNPNESRFFRKFASVFKLRAKGSAAYDARYRLAQDFANQLDKISISSEAKLRTLKEIRPFLDGDWVFFWGFLIRSMGHPHERRLALQLLIGRLFK